MLDLGAECWLVRCEVEASWLYASGLTTVRCCDAGGVIDGGDLDYNK